MVKQGFKFWFRASRNPALGQSLTPYILGVLFAVAAWLYNPDVPFYPIGLVLGALGFIGVGAAHTGINLLDDYFDYTKGAVAERAALIDGGFRARLHKCAYIESGEATAKETRNVAWLFIAFALACGAAVLVLGLLFLGYDWRYLALFAGLGLLLGVMYAGPPLRLSYHGFGELVVGVVFGALIAIPAYYVCTAHISAGIIWASIPCGLLTMNIVNTHAIMDFESDKAAHRTTFVVLLGSKMAGFWVDVVLLVAAYGCIIAGVVLGALPIQTLLVLITLPVAIGFLRLVHLYVTNPDQVETPKWWMGRFKQWEAYKEAGIEWFMLRWALARNLLIQFVLIVALTNLLNFDWLFGY
ncbi:MAG: prenyltransferase [Coriobacteriia bacterium]|jgi:1,4-dihydroxy-2-naphthoate octaprenyltransferase|nr:prenyltransferase [Coriobacteriia bacterium]MDR2714705.1 prenyltransferase [Coriobacteriales bacterium]